MTAAAFLPSSNEGVTIVLDCTPWGLHQAKQTALWCNCLSLGKEARQTGPNSLEILSSGGIGPFWVDKGPHQMGSN